MAGKRVLITGCCGQIGSELVVALRKKHGEDNVISLDIRRPDVGMKNFELADTLDKQILKGIIERRKIDIIYHLCGILSAKGEMYPDTAWNVNIVTLKNVLDLAVECGLTQVFWPSSIAVFGETTPRENTPQRTILEPTTMYGVTKVAGELLCQYYYKKFKVDVRSIRYPGLISYKTPPGGGTTDYACAIFHGAIKEKKYTCYLKEGTMLPMMYMDDAIRATIELMDADAKKLTVRTSYSLAAISFTPEELAAEIKKHIPEFSCSYVSDELRQRIADSWPKRIDDSQARKDWGWKHKFELPEITQIMLKDLKK